MIDTLQKTFKDTYTKQLIDGVKSGRTVSFYENGDFELDESKMTHIAGVYTPIGLQDRMIAAAKGKDRHGVDAAIELFKAYKGISPLIASSESFWAYLCHTELNEFVRMDWLWETAKNKQSFILHHYFFGKEYSRNALASLWWGVYQTYDEEREKNGQDPYELTRIFFKNYSFRVTWITILFRIKNALHGILEYLLAHPEVMQSHFENRIRLVCKYFNMIGASKQLSALPKSYFISEMERLHPAIIQIQVRDDVQNKEISAILQSALDEEIDADE